MKMSKLHEVKFKNELINHLLKLRHMQIGSRMNEGCMQLNSVFDSSLVEVNSL